MRVKDKKAGKAFLRQRRRHTPPRWRRKRVPTPANRASIGVYIHVQNDSSPINFPLTMGAVPALPLVSYAEPGSHGQRCRTQDTWQTLCARRAWGCGGRPGRRTDPRWPTLARSRSARLPFGTAACVRGGVGCRVWVLQ